MNIYIYSDGRNAKKKAALLFTNSINKKKGRVLLPTGKTPLIFYQYLSKLIKNKKRDLSEWTSFNLDEYLIGNNKEKISYSNYMKKNVFNKIKFKKNHILDKSTKDPIRECLRYKKNIQECKIDLAVLGIGENGHIGFNEPGSSKSSTVRKVKLTDSTIKNNFNKNKERVNFALTVGIKEILNSKKIILIATTKKKSDAIKNMIEGSVTKNCPASFLQNHNNVHVFLDKGASSRLNLEKLKKNKNNVIKKVK